MTDLETTRDHLRHLADTGHRGDCCQCGLSYCCGCIGHPTGKPWGWAALRWEEHAEKCPGNPAAPNCTGCLTASDRALAARLADEIDAHLTPDDEGREALL